MRKGDDNVCFRFISLLLMSSVDETLRLLVAADPGVFETKLDGEALYIQRGFSDRSNGSYLFFSFVFQYFEHLT